MGDLANVKNEELRQAAEAGDVRAQVWLAKRLYDGRRLKMDKVEAYKWIFVAVSRGHEPAKPFLKEFELFMTPEQIDAAKKDALPNMQRGTPQR